MCTYVYVSFLMPYNVYCMICHFVKCWHPIVYHVSCIMYRVSCIVHPVSCIIYCVCVHKDTILFSGMCHCSAPRPFSQINASQGNSYFAFILFWW
jgi:hypothetical protein